MLLKGSIKKKSSDSKKLESYVENMLNDEKIKQIPYLDYEKVSAIFISKEGKANDILIKYKENYLIDPEEISKISIDIMEEYSFLDNLNDKLLSDKNV
jgi:hypothetical protein